MPAVPCVGDTMVDVELSTIDTKLNKNNSSSSSPAVSTSSSVSHPPLPRSNKSLLPDLTTNLCTFSLVLLFFLKVNWMYQYLYVYPTNDPSTSFRFVGCFQPSDGLTLRANTGKSNEMIIQINLPDPLETLSILKPYESKLICLVPTYKGKVNVNHNLFNPKGKETMAERDYTLFMFHKGYTPTGTTSTFGQTGISVGTDNGTNGTSGTTYPTTNAYMHAATQKMPLSSMTGFRNPDSSFYYRIDLNPLTATDLFTKIEDYHCGWDRRGGAMETAIAVYRNPTRPPLDLSLLNPLVWIPFWLLIVGFFCMVNYYVFENFIRVRSRDIFSVDSYLNGSKNKHLKPSHMDQFLTHLQLAQVQITMHLSLDLINDNMVFESRTLEFHEQYDLTEVPLNLIKNKRVQMVCALDCPITFADDYTKNNVEKQKQRFIDDVSTRHVQMSDHEHANTPLKYWESQKIFSKYDGSTIMDDKENKNIFYVRDAIDHCCLNTTCYHIATLCCCNWLYRFLFEKGSAHTSVHVAKGIKITPGQPNYGTGAPTREQKAAIASKKAAIASKKFLDAIRARPIPLTIPQKLVKLKQSFLMDEITTEQYEQKKQFIKEDLTMEQRYANLKEAFLKDEISSSQYDLAKQELQRQEKDAPPSAPSASVDVDVVDIVVESKMALTEAQCFDYQSNVAPETKNNSDLLLHSVKKIPTSTKMALTEAQYRQGLIGSQSITGVAPANSTRYLYGVLAFSCSIAIPIIFWNVLGCGTFVQVGWCAMNVVNNASYSQIYYQGRVGSSTYPYEDYSFNVSNMYGDLCGADSGSGKCTSPINSKCIAFQSFQQNTRSLGSGCLTAPLRVSLSANPGINNMFKNVSMPCSAIIPSGTSGICQCGTDKHVKFGLQTPGYIGISVKCGHQPFTCDDICSNQHCASGANCVHIPNIGNTCVLPILEDGIEPGPTAYEVATRTFHGRNLPEWIQPPRVTCRAYPATGWNPNFHPTTCFSMNTRRNGPCVDTLLYRSVLNLYYPTWKPFALPDYPPPKQWYHVTFKDEYRADGFSCMERCEGYEGQLNCHYCK